MALLVLSVAFFPFMWAQMVEMAQKLGAALQVGEALVWTQDKAPDQFRQQICYSPAASGFHSSSRTGDVFSSCIQKDPFR